ncbi:DUF3617 domain-containing protein [Rhodoferax sp. UBA5149]|uniref:DUF3617 domain-containing protein n=1 Tax=Rhodoferax sp. UBA5149 TaxID=1947379 RepID=UPI0025FE9AFA|nr:DUF3617 domain-containing protein [Rhodoferax sp. UBA5149]
MNKLHHVLLTAVLASGAMGAAAQTLKPGLWEINNKMSSSSGEMEKTMAEAQKQIASMPPDQRKMVADMMAKQGVGMGAGGAVMAKVCMTREMVEHNEVATQQGDCRQTSSPRTGNTQKFSFVCTRPPSRGEGQVTFVSPEAYTLKMMFNSTATGKPEKMKMDATGKFLSSDCGTVKPLALPKK